MATHLQLYVLENILPAEAEKMEIKYDELHSPNIIIAEYSYGWAMLESETIPSCVGSLKQLMFNKENYPLFVLMNDNLAMKIVTEVWKSKSAGEGQRIISPDDLRVFLQRHMGKTMFINES